MNQESHNVVAPTSFSQLSLEDLINFDVKNLLKSQYHHESNLSSPYHQQQQKPITSVNESKHIQKEENQLASGRETAVIESIQQNYPMSVPRESKRQLPTFVEDNFSSSSANSPSLTLADATVMSGWVQIVDSSHYLDVYALGQVTDITGTFCIYQNERMTVLLGSFVVGHPKTLVMLIRDMFCIRNGSETCTCRCSSPADAAAWTSFLCSPMFSSLPITTPEQLNEILSPEVDQTSPSPHRSIFETYQLPALHGEGVTSLHDSGSQETLNSTYTAVDSIALTARADTVVQNAKANYRKRKMLAEKRLLREEMRKKAVADRDELLRLRAVRLKAQGVNEESYSYKPQKSIQSFHGQPSMHSLRTVHSVVSALTQQSGDGPSVAERVAEKIKHTREKNKSKKERFARQVAQREAQLRAEHQAMQLLRQEEAEEEAAALENRRSAEMYRKLQEMSRLLPPTEALMRAQACVVIQKLWRGVMVRSQLDTRRHSRQQLEGGTANALLGGLGMESPGRKYDLLTSQIATGAMPNQRRDKKGHLIFPNKSKGNIIVLPSSHTVPLLNDLSVPLHGSEGGGGIGGKNAHEADRRTTLSNRHGAVDHMGHVSSGDRKESKASLAMRTGHATPNHVQNPHGVTTLSSVQEESRHNTGTATDHVKGRMDCSPNGSYLPLVRDGPSHQSMTSMVSDITDTDFNSHYGEKTLATEDNSVSVSGNTREKRTKNHDRKGSLNVDSTSVIIGDNFMQSGSDREKKDPDGPLRRNSSDASTTSINLKRTASMKDAAITLEKIGEYNVLSEPGNEPQRLTDEELLEYLRLRRKATEDRMRAKKSHPSGEITTSETDNNATSDLGASVEAHDLHQLSTIVEGENGLQTASPTVKGVGKPTATTKKTSTDVLTEESLRERESVHSPINRTDSMASESIVVEKMGDYNILKVPGEEPRRMSNEELNEYLKERKRAKKEKKRMLRHASRSGEFSDKNKDTNSSRNDDNARTDRTTPVDSPSRDAGADKVRNVLDDDNVLARKTYELNEYMLLSHIRFHLHLLSTRRP